MKFRIGETNCIIVMDLCKVHILIYTIFLFIIIATGFETGDLRNHLGSRTPYRFIANKDDSPIQFPECTDTKIWMIIRHGTRLPKSKFIERRFDILRDLKYEILRQHSFGKGKLSAEQIKDFEEWEEGSINVDQGMNLAHEGEDEMVLLAERMQKRFPNAIPHIYNNKTFLFRYTATQRAQQSARFFTLGLFDKKGSQNVIFDPAAKLDPVLRFYKHCDRWKNEVKKNPATYKQRDTYVLSQEMNETINSMSKKLGLDYALPYSTVNLVYKMCGYETAWQKHWLSPWCSALDENSIKTLEYAEDLKFYWKDGYGHRITYRQACVTLKHMFDSLVNKTNPKSIFLFSHSGTLLKLLSHLGLYKPRVILKWDNRQEDRTWRSSKINSFATNLAFVLYKCVDGDYILPMHQERPLKLPGCEKELCSLKDLLKIYQDTIFNCDYKDICKLEQKNEESDIVIN